VAIYLQTANVRSEDDIDDTPSASLPYTAEEPTGMTSIRSIAMAGMVPRSKPTPLPVFEPAAVEKNES